MSFYSDHIAYERRRRGALLRKQRMDAARALATHTDLEWICLCAEMGNRCLVCGIHASELIGGKLTKDHITPIACGGSDGINNLQPSCRECNASKGAQGDFDWLTYRRTHGFKGAA